MSIPIRTDDCAICLNPQIISQPTREPLSRAAHWIASFWYGTSEPLKCTHVFHDRCIISLVSSETETSKLCPLCRGDNKTIQKRDVANAVHLQYRRLDRMRQALFTSTWITVMNVLLSRRYPQMSLMKKGVMTSLSGMIFGTITSLYFERLSSNWDLKRRVFNWMNSTNITEDQLLDCRAADPKNLEGPISWFKWNHQALGLYRVKMGDELPDPLRFEPKNLVFNVSEEGTTSVITLNDKVSDWTVQLPETVAEVIQRIESEIAPEILSTLNKTAFVVGKSEGSPQMETHFFLSLTHVLIKLGYITSNSPIASPCEDGVSKPVIFHMKSAIET